jgi:hypothetical protein
MVQLLDCRCFSSLEATELLRLQPTAMGLAIYNSPTFQHEVKYFEVAVRTTEMERELAGGGQLRLFLWAESP